MALSSNVQTLSILGVSSDNFRTMNSWCKGKRVGLRFKAEEKCCFVREVTKDVDSGSRVETKASLGSLSAAFTTKVVTTVKEYIWKYEATYELLAFCGVGHASADQLQITSRSYQHELTTSAKSNPRKEHKIHVPIEVDITLILSHLRPSDFSVSYSIDRLDPGCRTPRRNQDVEAVLRQSTMIFHWASSITNIIKIQLFSVENTILLYLHIYTIVIFVVRCLQASVIAPFDDCKAGKNWNSRF